MDTLSSGTSRREVHRLLREMRRSDLLEQELLEQYLTRGITLFERSTTGAMLDQIANLAYSSFECPVCPDHCGVLATGAWCGRCKGTGIIHYRRDYSGNGSVTARPTTTGQHSLRSGVEDDRLADYAVVSRALSRLGSSTRFALETAYGEDGAWCERSERWERSWSLAPHTVPGQRLLRGTDHGGKERLLERLTAVAMEDEGKSKPSRAGQLLAARGQAQAWLVDATRRWNELFQEADDAG